MASDTLCHAAQRPALEGCSSMAAHDDAINVLQAGRREDRLSGETISHLQSGRHARQFIGTGNVLQIADRLGMLRLDGLFALLRWPQEGCYSIERMRHDAQEQEGPARGSRESRCKR